MCPGLRASKSNCRAWFTASKKGRQHTSIGAQRPRSTAGNSSATARTARRSAGVSSNPQCSVRPSHTHSSMAARAAPAVYSPRPPPPAPPLPSSNACNAVESTLWTTCASQYEAQSAHCATVGVLPAYHIKRIRTGSNSSSNSFESTKPTVALPTPSASSSVGRKSAACRASAWTTCSFPAATNSAAVCFCASRSARDRSPMTYSASAL
mmetsp:Transcript_86995/g.243911  ORF Transcript_86995/g.243911 Transcript_86995/m.243911 type:complete len:209 (+) Transcript_86995:1676-2302(+)